MNLHSECARLNKIRRKLPNITSGFLMIDLFTEVHFSENIAWLVSHNSVYRAFRKPEGWCSWEKRNFTPNALRDWLAKRQ